jgi:hypothetical protein
VHQPVGMSRKRTLGIALIVVAVAITALLAVRQHAQHSGPVKGTPEAAPGPAPVPASGASTPAPQAGWTTLRNPDAGLSYQIPPGWTTAPQDGTIGTVTLTQGARLAAYQCGNPAQGYYRGALGSAAAPSGDPALLAASLAEQAATQYYLTPAGPAPAVTASRPVEVRLVTGGRTITGALVTATSHQTADTRCLAGDGEVDVLVLRLDGRDGILLVNADTAGGPATPPPGSAAQLRQILATVEPIAG